jgi:ABC-type transporter Mla subunit MlaD
LAGTLGELQQTLKETQRGIQGSGEAFGQHMAEAASGKSAEIEAAMGQIFGQLGGQIEALQRGLGGFQDGMINHLETTRESVAAAQDDAVKAVGQASTEAADALRTGLGDALVMINREVTRFSTSLGAAEEALTAQGQALRDTTRKSGEVAMAFGQTARAVQAASTPLIQSGERIAGAAEQMTAAVARSVETLQAGQMSLKELADRLAQHNETLAGSWENYQERFEGVDESLGQAVAELAKSAQEQGQRLNERVVEIDRSFAEAIDKLNPALGSLSESAESLSEDVEKLVGGFEKNAAD